ncbi:MAG: sigma-70 family RNA polymerase sigma factor [Planctomycetota bacterium]|nr:MAG: sigma-70 family RNA polymerase sigma factor [Planctomycetota bacterium]
MTAGLATPIVITPIGGAAAERVTLAADEPAVIGRADDCRIHVGDPHISMQHARVRCTDGWWYLTDLESRNGTSLNRWKLSPNDPVRLHDGDVITLGPCCLTVTLADSSPAAESSLAAPAADAVSATYATRGSMFIRLNDARPLEKEIAWEEFRARYAPVIIGYSRNAGLPSQDAEDILQDVMLGFFRLSADFHYDAAKGRFRGYLKQATLNAIRKRIRGDDPVRRVPDDLLDEQAVTAESHWERQWAQRIMTRALDEARRRVDEQTYEAFDLYARRDVAAEEVAARLGISVNSVHQAKSRVMRVVMAVVDRLRADEG